MQSERISEEFNEVIKNIVSLALNFMADFVESCQTILFSYIVSHFYICYNVIRNLLCYSSTKNENPSEVGPRGFLFRFLWWLIPQAGHRLFITVQPFVDAMTHYTSHDSKYKTYYVIHSHTSFPYRWEAVTIPL